jgi:hypothetical protein
LALHHKLKHGLKCCACRSCFHNSNGVLKTIAQGVRIEGGLCEFARAQQQRHQTLTSTPTTTIIITTQYLRAHTTTTRPVARVFIIHENQNMASSAAPVACVFMTPTVSSKPSRWPLGLKVGYASSRAHDNKQDQSLGFGFNMACSAAPVACVFITPTVSSKDSCRPLGLKVGYACSRRTKTNKTSRSGLAFHHKLKHECLRAIHAARTLNILYMSCRLRSHPPPNESPR